MAWRSGFRPRRGLRQEPREAKFTLDNDGVLEWKRMLMVSAEQGGEGPASDQLVSTSLP